MMTLNTYNDFLMYISGLNDGKYIVFRAIEELNELDTLKIF